MLGEEIRDDRYEILFPCWVEPGGGEASFQELGSSLERAVAGDERRWEEGEGRISGRAWKRVRDRKSSCTHKLRASFAEGSRLSTEKEP